MQNKLKVNYLRVEKRLEDQTGRKRGRGPERGEGVKKKASVSRVTFYLNLKCRLVKSVYIV